jgi:hypothetical protein
MPLKHQQTQFITVSPDVSPPLISIAFGAASIIVGNTTTLVFTISNPNPTEGLTGIAFIDNLPAGLEVGPVPGVLDLCTAGTVTAIAGSSQISYFGGSLAAGASCTITVTVKGTSAGTKQNQTDPITARESGAGLASNIASLDVVAALEDAAFMLGTSLKIVTLSPVALASSTATVTSNSENTFCIDSNQNAFYLSQKSPDTDSRLQIFDCLNRAAPSEIANIAALQSNAGYLAAVNNGILWVVCNAPAGSLAPNSLRAFDVSDPTTPVLLATYDLAAGFALPQTNMTACMVDSSGFVYVSANGTGLGDQSVGIYDGSNPLAVLQKSVTTITAVPFGSVVIGLEFPLLFVLSVASQLEVYDVTLPGTPALLGSVAGLGNAIDMTQVPDGGFLFLTARSPVDKGIRIVDVSTPAVPALVASPLPSGTVNRNTGGLAARNGRLVLANLETAIGPNKAQVYDTAGAGLGTLAFLGEAAYNVTPQGFTPVFIDN